MFDIVVLTEDEEAVTKALGIVDPVIERIATVKSQQHPLYRAAPGGVVLKLRGIKGQVPIGSMGGGMWRMLGLALSLASARGGVLLVDEIDTGPPLHGDGGYVADDRRTSGPPCRFRCSPRRTAATATRVWGRPWNPTWATSPFRGSSGIVEKRSVSRTEPSWQPASATSRSGEWLPGIAETTPESCSWRVRRTSVYSRTSWKRTASCGRIPPASPVFIEPYGSVDEILKPESHCA